jgi:hypothetical protein
MLFSCLLSFFVAGNFTQRVFLAWRRSGNQDCLASGKKFKLLTAGPFDPIGSAPDFSGELPAYARIHNLGREW